MREFGPIFLLNCVGFHPKFPVSEKISWELGSQVPEENPALAEATRKRNNKITAVGSLDRARAGSGIV